MLNKIESFKSDAKTFIEKNNNVLVGLAAVITAIAFAIMIAGLSVDSPEVIGRLKEHPGSSFSHEFKAFQTRSIILSLSGAMGWMVGLGLLALFLHNRKKGESTKEKLKIAALITSIALVAFGLSLYTMGHFLHEQATRLAHYHTQDNFIKNRIAEFGQISKKMQACVIMSFVSAGTLGLIGLINACNNKPKKRDEIEGIELQTIGAQK